MYNLCYEIIYIIITLYTIILAMVDNNKQRKTRYINNLLIIVPCYNCKKTVKHCINSIYNTITIPFKLIVIDDASTDDTLNILKKLKEIRGYSLVENKNNIGKCQSINTTWKNNISEYIMIIDSDVIINEKGCQEMFNRIMYDNRVGAVSTRISVIKKGIFSWFIGLDYGFMALFNMANNITTSLSLWGGCSLYKRKALESINGLKNSMIIEDMDSALRLIKKGWRVEQGYSPSYTYPPESINKWVEQKLRWAAGGLQCFAHHPIQFIKSPIIIGYSLIYFMGYLLIISGLFYHSIFNITLYTAIIIFILNSLPAYVIEVESYKDIKKIWYLIFYSLVYYPLSIILVVIGFIKGIYLLISKRKGGRAWVN